MAQFMINPVCPLPVSYISESAVDKKPKHYPLVFKINYFLLCRKQQQSNKRQKRHKCLHHDTISLVYHIK